MSHINWKDILMRKEALANAADADWIIHIDPDELRESPWGRDVTLRQALFAADRLGYNLINFAKLVIFHPVHGYPAYYSGADLKSTLQHFLVNKFGGDAHQFKAWKTYRSQCVGNDAALESSLTPAVLIDIATSGGHYAFYLNTTVNGIMVPAPESRVFPFYFILHHYPIRSDAHGRRKVFQERKARFNASERGHDWHTQYDSVIEDHPSFIPKPTEKKMQRTDIEGALPSHLFSTRLPCLPADYSNSVAF